MNEFRRVTQRPDEIGETVALFERRDAHGRGADSLYHDGHGAFSGVVIADGQRDAFPFLIDDDDQELPGLCGVRHTRRLDFHQVDSGGQLGLFQDLKHAVFSRLVFFRLGTDKGTNLGGIWPTGTGKC